MTTPNDSVIICDSPKPSNSDGSTNYRKRLRSCSEVQSLLGTVYESPLVHLKRNLVKNCVANIDNDVTVVSTPAAKRRKISQAPKKNKRKLDTSVVVLNDCGARSIIEIALSDVESNDGEQTSNTRKKVKRLKAMALKKKTKSAMKSPVKNLRAQRFLNRSLRKKEIENTQKNLGHKNCKQSTGVNDENRDAQIMDKNENGSGDGEDIEVVWVSNTNADSSFEPTISTEMVPYIVDTVATPANLMDSPAFSRRTEKARRSNTKKKLKLQKNAQPPKDLAFEPSTGSSSVPIKPTSNLHNKGSLREIVIDGTNVAMGHKFDKRFSERGLQIVINYFRDRGHVVTAFVPQSMRTRDRELLERLHSSGYVVFTPSRKIGGKKITPYDDRFILEYATKCNGIVVSSDQYRDLWHEKPEWRDTIENRLLTPTFVGDYLMFPEDPLGRRGPNLDEFLRY